MRRSASRLRLLLAALFVWVACLLMPGLAHAATCAPATGQGTAPADFRSYCWLDFSTYDDTTARSNNGQNLSFTLPDKTVVSMNVKTTTASLSAVAVPSWTGSAFGNTAFTGIPGKPILYTTTQGTTPKVTLSNISVTPPSGSTASYSIVVGDGESSNENETLNFTTDKNAWVTMAQIPNGASTLYPDLAGTGTRSVTLTGKAGTVGSYVFRSDGNPTTITATLKAGGLQGVIIGMRYASVSVVSQINNMRYNAADQFAYSITTTNNVLLAQGTTTGTAIDSFTPANVPTVAASYPFVVTQSLAAGSVGTAANYTTSLTCTNSNGSSTTTLPSNRSGSSYTFTSLAYNDAVLCTFTNTPIFNQIVGTVYADANHDTTQDTGEGGPGSGFYVKLAPVSGGACTSPATQWVAPDPSTGAYTIPNLPTGTYCVILDNNNTLSDVTPTLPSGWLGTQNAQGFTQVVVATPSPTPPPQNFGVYNGSRVTGTVFADTGVGSGTPNNGTKDGTEPGINAVVVTAKSGATTITTATTIADGSFTVWLPATVTGTVVLTPTIPTNSLATGGSVGTTAGTFSRPSVSFTNAAGQSYTGVGFGMALPSTFVANGAQTAQAGMTVTYAHTFTAGSGGSVSFALTNTSTPNNSNWSAVLYRDASCNAAMDAGEALVSAPVTVTAGQQVCLLLKEFVPAGIGYGALASATVTATFTYTNASPAITSTLSVTDVTTAGEPNALSLKKQVTNVTKSSAISTSTSASPGDVLLYTLTAQNNGSGSLTTLVINDATPAYTTFVSAACPATLPTGITSCTLTQPTAGQAGFVQWSFAGSLTAGLQMVVTYQVKLDQ